MIRPDKEKFLKKSIIQEMVANAGEQVTFVTAGAYMYCTLGTHEEVLNQLQTNGTYINNTTMMTVADCKVSTSTPDHWQGAQFDVQSETIDGNLHSFGYCRSPIHPLKTVDQRGEGMTPDIHSTAIYDYDPDAEVDLTTGQDRIYPCVPRWLPATPFDPSGRTFSPEQWQNGNEKVLVNGVPALTNKSCLYCKYGGEVKFLSNGMEPIPGDFINND